MDITAAKEAYTEGWVDDRNGYSKKDPSSTPKSNVSSKNAEEKQEEDWGSRGSESRQRGAREIKAVIST